MSILSLALLSYFSNYIHIHYTHTIGTICTHTLCVIFTPAAQQSRVQQWRRRRSWHGEREGDTHTKREREGGGTCEYRKQTYGISTICTRTYTCATVFQTMEESADAAEEGAVPANDENDGGGEEEEQQQQHGEVERQQQNGEEVRQEEEEEEEQQCDEHQQETQKDEEVPHDEEKGPPAGGENCASEQQDRLAAAPPAAANGGGAATTSGTNAPASGELSSLGRHLTTPSLVTLDDERLISPRMGQVGSGELGVGSAVGGRSVVGLGNGGSLALGSFFFCEERHLLALCQPDEEQEGAGLVSKWRMKDRLKTVAVAIALCLNIGVDPPDVIRIPPCAKLQAWVDPFALPPQKSLEQIGKKLQSQYERWQPRARYKTSLDPTFDDIRKLCASCRRHAKGERVLFHYNGHGVPRPTANGELWVFNSSYTQYIPLSVYDLQSWLSAPAIYIFDCSAAGLILNAFRQFAEQRCLEEPDMGSSGSLGGSGASSGPVGGRRLLSDSIVLAACGSKERLPLDSSLPADIFTACLTTPIKAALWWFCERSLLRDEGITQELVDAIPGRQTDRKTPLGELNWIFTAITDTIAWNMLPRKLFQRLFRQDLLVASLFRNYLLAERVLQSVSCTPVSYPALPATYQHTMWCAWDMAAEGCLAQLPALLASSDPSGTGGHQYQVSPFFSQQLKAFEVWLEHGHPGKSPPEQLPIVLQVLLSQSHRLKALVLLGRFLDMGPWAVDLALSVGIFPYVLKLLQTTAADLRQILIFIWAKILALDRKCQVDLTKDNGHEYFVRFLEATDVAPAHQSMAAFCLASIMDGYPRGQMACASTGLMGICSLYISTATTTDATPQLLLRWLCLCLGKLWEDMNDSQMEAMEGGVPDTIAPLLQNPRCDPEVRAAAVYALGNIIRIATVSAEADDRAGGGGLSRFSNNGSIPDTPTMNSVASSGANHQILSGNVGNGGGGSVSGSQPQEQTQEHHPSSAPVRDNTEPNTAIGPASVQRVSTSGGVNDGGSNTNLSPPRPNPVNVLEPLEEKTRLAAERSVALHIMTALADGSPVVRREVCVFLGRFILAHREPMRATLASWMSSHWKPESGGAQTKTKSGSGRLNFFDSANMNTFRSGMSGIGSAGILRKNFSNGSDTDSVLRSASPQARPNATSSSSIESDSNADAFHMLLTSANGTVQMYARILDGVVSMAFDPFPPISQSAKTALATIGIDIDKYLPRTKETTMLSSSGASLSPQQMSGGGSSAGGPGSSTSGTSQDSAQSSRRASFSLRFPSFIPSLAPTSSLFSSSFGSSQQQQQQQQQRVSSPLASGNGIGAAGSADNVQPSRQNGTVSVQHTNELGVGGSMGSKSVSSPGTERGTPNAPGGDIFRSASAVWTQGDQSEPVTAEMLSRMPKSAIYLRSCTHFSKPLWDGRKHADLASSHPSWTAPSTSKWRTNERRRIASESAERCRTSRISRMSDVIDSVQLNSAGPAAAMAFCPFDPVLCCISRCGDVSMWNYSEKTLTSRFNLGSTQVGPTGVRGVVPPAPAQSLHVVNEFDNAMLAVGTSDGCVRVWRDPFGPSPATLVTAWQAVPYPRQGLRCPEQSVRAFQWQQHTGLMFVGDLDRRIRVWDVCKERCIEIIDGCASAPISTICASSGSGASVVAGYENGCVQHFDLRDPSRIAMSISPATGHAVVSSSIVGPSNTRLAVGHRDGLLSIYDLRACSTNSPSSSTPSSPRDPSSPSSPTAAAAAAVSQVQAHLGGMLAMNVHAHANVMATSSADGTVKIWNSQLTLISTMRQQGNYLGHRGSASLLLMHPYKVLLGASSFDNNTITLYGGDGSR